MHEQYLKAEKRRSTFDGYYLRMAGNAKTRSKAGLFSCEINAKFLRDMHTKQGGKCALSGISFTIQRRSRQEAAPFNPSLDRINPKIGYIPSNVRLVCHWANVMKYSYNDTELFKMCHSILKYNKQY